LILVSCKAKPLLAISWKNIDPLIVNADEKITGRVR
jgi:hypothetical protein